MPLGLVGFDLDRLASVLALPERRGARVFRMQPAQFHACTRHARYNSAFSRNGLKWLFSEKEWKKYCLNEIDDELYKSNFCPISNHFSQVKSLRPLKIGLEDTCATRHLRNEILAQRDTCVKWMFAKIDKCFVEQISLCAIVLLRKCPATCYL